MALWGLQDLIAVAKLEERNETWSSNPISRQLVDIEILYLLKSGSMSGYELRKRLQRSFSINVSYGTLYPHLSSLEKSRLIEGAWHQKESSSTLKKKVYSLTPSGTIALTNSVRTLAETTLNMQFVLSEVNLSDHLEQSEEADFALENVERLFSSSGYRVGKMLKVKGFSGTEHVLELFATKGEPKPERVIFATAREKLTIGHVMKVRALATDVLASKSAIIALAEVEKDALKLASFYGIVVSQGPEWMNSVMNFVSQRPQSSGLVQAHH